MILIARYVKKNYTCMAEKIAKELYCYIKKAMLKEDAKSHPIWTIVRISGLSEESLGEI